MGAVHRAEGCSGRLDGQPLVIKSLLTLRQSDASARHAFREEARILSMMSHENIVRVFDFLDAGDNLYLVMEFIAGDTLSQLNRRCAAADLLMPLPLVLRIGIDAARALHHAHMLVDPNGQHLRVVHRDVSPQNIMLDQSDR